MHLLLVVFLASFASQFAIKSFCFTFDWKSYPLLSEMHLLLALSLELLTFKILATERLQLMEFDNRLIIDCFANIVNILIWSFSTNDRFISEEYESNYLENPFQELKGVNLLSKTHCYDKGNLKLKTVLQELLHVDRFSRQTKPSFSAAIPSSLCACSRNTEVLSC